ncbi:MAG TPA: hypothetical protein VNS80_03035 [Pseudolysinimonas sp.]|nr:hypothetical protein [Pseudolysinimonas sp.]
MTRAPQATLATVLAAALLLVGTAAPASAAGSPRPQVWPKSTATVFEQEFTNLTVEYRCAAGHSADLDASVWQGGTAASPRTVYDTTSTTVPPLTCDGKRHSVLIHLGLVGYDPEGDAADYEYLENTIDGYGRGHVTLVFTDTSTGVADVDRYRVEVRSRELG